MDRTEALTLMEKRRNAWLQNDLDTYLNLFSDDFAFSDGVEETRGRAAWEDVIRRNDERSSPVSWEFHSIAVDGSKILAEWTVTIEPKGSGTKVALKAMSISEAKDGRFTSHHEYRWPVG
jgi:hypothetical protein